MANNRAKQVGDAVARGRAALTAGDRGEATRWLERAHRLAPQDGTITLLLASVAIGDDNAKAAALFAQALEIADVRDAWLGLATARFLMRDMTAAQAAVAGALSRFALWPELAHLASQLGQAAGASGWCGLTGDGRVVVVSSGLAQLVVKVDAGQTIRLRSARDLPMSTLAGVVPCADDAGPSERRPPIWWQHALIGTLPPAWPRGQWLGVTDGQAHLTGSPISLRAIGRTEGRVEAWRGGLRGWAWHPGDPERDPVLTVEAESGGREIVATRPAVATAGQQPLARPRSFTVSRSAVAGSVPPRVRGRDGLVLAPGPLRQSDSRLQPPDAVRTDDATRRPADLARWRSDTLESVLLLTHDDGGGVESRIQTSIECHMAAGRRAIVLRPLPMTNGAAGIVASTRELPELRFELPRQLPALLRLLRAMRPREIELHHFLNHDSSVFEMIRMLGVPYDVHTHDYAWFCPRIALVGRGRRYCGEPPASGCEACVAKSGSYLNDGIGVTALLDRSRTVLSGARRVLAPSHDAAERMARHFPGISPVVVAHEDDDAIEEPPPLAPVQGMVRVCVAGAIGLHKGFHILLACARDAERRGLDLTFVVAGTTIDDGKLMDTGRVFVTGPYRQGEAVGLIRAQQAALALLPSIWPETWCLGLSELWRAGLHVAAFDIGAPAERIRRTGRGMLLPPGLPPAEINDTLLNAVRRRSFLPIRRSSAYNLQDDATLSK